jgi:hypothetical protein
MTTGERSELGKLVRLRAKVAKDDARTRGLFLIADGEAKLATIFKFEDDAWKDITAEGEKKIRELQRELRERCNQRGIPEGFRPSLHLGWCGRGYDNDLASRRAELRRVLHVRVEADVRNAQLEIDRESERQLTQLAADALTSSAAKAYLGNMPTSESLLPQIASLQLGTGEVIRLEHVTEPSIRNAGVTAECNAVTDGRPDPNQCEVCEKKVGSGRGRYCSNACRQAAYRRRSAPVEKTEGKG